MHTDGCAQPRGLQPGSLGFSYFGRPRAVLALPVTDCMSVVLTCIRVSHLHHWLCHFYVCW